MKKLLSYVFETDYEGCGEKDKAMIRAVAASFLSVTVCMLCFLGTTFAWMMDTTESRVSGIQSARYDLEINVFEILTSTNLPSSTPTDLSTDGYYYLETDTSYRVVINDTNTTTAQNGFCLIYAAGSEDAPETVYRTDLISFINENDTYTFTITGACKIKIVPMWGRAYESDTNVASYGGNIIVPVFHVTLPTAPNTTAPALAVPEVLTETNLTETDLNKAEPENEENKATEENQNEKTQEEPQNTESNPSKGPIALDNNETENTDPEEIKETESTENTGDDTEQKGDSQ